MLSVILFILKVIGIILLVILGILLIVIGSILFIPIRYRVEGCFLEEQNKCLVSISWAGIVFRAKAGYQMPDIKEDDVESVFEKYAKGMFYSIRVLGITLLTSEDRKTLLTRFLDWRKRRREKKREKEAEKNQKKHKTTETISDDIELNYLPEEEFLDELEESLDEFEDISMDWEAPEEIISPQNTEELEQSIPKIQNERQGNVPLSETKEKKSNWKKNKQKKSVQREKKIEESEEKWYNKIGEKIENLMDQYEALKKFYYQNQSQYAMKKMRRLIEKTIKYILPTRCKGEIQYGFDDPSLTGEVYGILCITGLSLRKDVTIVADFQNQVLKGTMKAQGRFRVIFAVRMAISIFFDKKLKAVYKKGKEILGGIRL
ncbi:MAG: DUF2953 domain-containing protein [Lachnospiraceae bacterium]|nr:DUF2953 domain-containing protein [Lachnospiraceae bacterium]